MDRGAWWTTYHPWDHSWTQLKWLSTYSTFLILFLEQPLGGEWIFNSRLQWESNNNNLKKKSEKGNIKIEQKLITYIHFLKNLGGAHHVACRILVPWPGIELHPWQWKQRVLTARLTGFPIMCIFKTGWKVISLEKSITYSIFWERMKIRKRVKKLKQMKTRNNTIKILKNEIIHLYSISMNLLT